VLVSPDDPTELFRSTSVAAVGESVREAHATIRPLVIRTVIKPVRRSIVPRVEPQALAATDDHRMNANEPLSNSFAGVVIETVRRSGVALTTAGLGS
jgi:hypothetical protein